MSLDEIITLLKQQGCGSKQQVLLMLENANAEELVELRNSINEKINKLSEV